METGGFVIVSLIACGMGLAVWVTDRRSPTSRALALFLVLTGVAVAANAHAATLYGRGPLPYWVRGLGFLECLVFLAATEWGIAVGRTVAQDGERRERGTLMIRGAQALSIVYAILAATLPDLRATQVVNALSFQSWPKPGFYLFVTPAILAGLLVIVAGIGLLRARPDRAEAGRIVAMLLAMPLLTSSVVLPPSLAPIALALGEIVFLIGAFRYHVIQGARGNFMSQFLSPQVADMVRNRGLKQVMARQRLNVSIVAVDIRGFTAFAQGREPEVVLRLLRDFYAAIGTAVSRYGGTIKDLAGDGALILIGAPVPFPDHAARALALARRLQSHVRPVVKSHSSKLGLGVGAATGDVAAGIVGQRARYEYAAVGPPVNLAARLCDKAADGEIKVDASTLEAAGEALPDKRERQAIKGVPEPVTAYILTAEEAA